MASLTIYPDHIKIRLVQQETLDIVMRLMANDMNSNWEATISSVYRKLLITQLPHNLQTKEILQVRDRLRDFVANGQTLCKFSCLEA